MSLNKNELKCIIYDFNQISNRLLRAYFADYDNVLKKYISFLNESDVIRSYINDCGISTLNIQSDFSKIIESGAYSFGDTPSEEVAAITCLLKHIVENGVQVPYVFRSFSNSNKFQDITKAFNDRIVSILVGHIERHLSKIGIMMGLDDTIRYNIKIENGQVILASDNAIVNATMNNIIDHSKLIKLIETVKKENWNGLSDEQIETLNDWLETIEHQSKQPEPKRGVFKSAIESLTTFTALVQFPSALQNLIDFLTTLIMK
jgi:hypothetical protein